MIEISLPLETDSDNSYHSVIKIRRGTKRPTNIVIEIDNRILEVNYKMLEQAMQALKEKEE